MLIPLIVATFSKSSDEYWTSWIRPVSICISGYLLLFKTYLVYYFGLYIYREMYYDLVCRSVSIVVLYK